VPSLQMNRSFISPWSLFFQGPALVVTMSTTITSDRANLRKHGTMLAYIFANEDCGSFVYSSVTIIVLTCYKDVMEAVQCRKEVNMTFWRQHYERLIGVSLPPSLAIVVDHSLIAAFDTLYHRLMIQASMVHSLFQSHLYILVTLQSPSAIWH